MNVDSGALEAAHDLAPDLRKLMPFLRFLANIFGDDSEIALYDIRQAKRSVVAIANARLGGHTLRDPAADAVVAVLESEERRHADYVVEYESRSPNGTIFRSNSYVIRGDDGRAVAMLSVNIDVQRLVQAKEVFERLSQMSPITGSQPAQRVALSPKELVKESIDTEVANAGIHPSVMSSADKYRVIQKLHDAGVFLIHGAVPLVAKAVLLSEPSIYRLISTARRAVAETGDSEERAPRS
jgi:predicted transcriptional regulator YheO